MFPGFAPVVLVWSCQPDYLAQKNVLITKREIPANGKCTKCSYSPSVISKVLAACMTKLITARARKNKRTARMLAKTI